MNLTFTVYGTPVPQGSARAFIPKGWKRPVITAANAKTKPWRQEIAGCALAEMEKQNQTLGTQPVFLKCEFFFERPKSLKKSVAEKTTKPDLDKLIRALQDALTGIVFKDDAQVISVCASKQFGSPARCQIQVAGGEFSQQYFLVSSLRNTFGK